MWHRPSLLHLICGLAVGLAVLGSPDARGDVWSVAAGYDLFQTEAGTSFDGISFTGVPLGTYNFGSGAVNTYNTDTIIQRLSAVSVTGGAGSTGTTALKVDALQLVSTTTVPANTFGMGSPAGTYYVTLDPTQPSGSTMTIEFNSNSGGTFASSLNINVDFHYGSLTGMVVNPGGTELTLSQGDLATGAGTPWGRTAPPGSVLIPGVDYKLPGATALAPLGSGDFFPTTVTEEHFGGGQHVVDPATTPEPCTWIAWAMAGMVVPIYARWKRRRA